MTVSILWQVVKPAEGKRLPGTSNDKATFDEIWPRGVLCQEDIPKLRAMHLAARIINRDQPTLWSALADALESVGDHDIEVWGEY